MRHVVMGFVGLMLVTGCSGRKSSLLLERQARGPLADAGAVARAVQRAIEPPTRSQVQRGIEIEVSYADAAYLKTLFSKREIFGPYAGKNPYFPENLIFYIKITNKGQEPIFINPGAFVLVDDRGNQYSPIGVDYVTAFADARSRFGAARGLLADARPGYFGVNVPVGRMMTSKPQGQFALIKQSSLEPGFLHPGVVYDGLLAFWSPTRDAATLRLILNGIKTAFDANDMPQASLTFPYEFKQVLITAEPEPTR